MLNIKLQTSAATFVVCFCDKVLDAVSKRDVTDGAEP